MQLTIKSDFTREEIIKKSRFICELKRISNEEKARTFIAAVKKQHEKANHCCFTYTLGTQQEIQRASDDGEPSGTAGFPMLEILRKREITNVCAVVTRYFGGIKLGTGGLIRAYSGSVRQAVDAVGLVQFVEQQEIILRLDYPLFDRLNHFLTAENLLISESSFLSNVSLHLFVNLDAHKSFLTKLSETFAGKVQIELGKKQKVEQEVKK